MSAFTHPNILSLLGVVLRGKQYLLRVLNKFHELILIWLSQKATLVRWWCLSLCRTVIWLSCWGARGKPMMMWMKTKYRSWRRNICFGWPYKLPGGWGIWLPRDSFTGTWPAGTVWFRRGPPSKLLTLEWAGMSTPVTTIRLVKPKPTLFVPLWRFLLQIGGSRLLPVRWMSPESVVYGRFTLESDIWSFGVVLWEIYSFGKQPYYGHSNEEVVKLILDGIMLIPPEECPSLICELMKNCWKTEPRHRITFPNICDKLELTYEKFVECEPDQYTIENEVKKFKPSTLNKSLPRPPRLPMLAQEDLVDAQGYLLPKEVKEPAQYLETLPDWRRTGGRKDDNPKRIVWPDAGDYLGIDIWTMRLRICLRLNWTESR